MTHYLRFSDAIAGMAALDDAGLLDDDLNFIIASHNHALDVIGEIPECAGWHVNFIGKLPEEWEEYVVTPLNPIRIFL
jgi:hypothetical protein